MLFVNKGFACKQAGQYELAITCFNIAINLDPKNDKAYLNKGLTFEKMGNQKEANKCYNQAVAINPSLLENGNFS